jgi:hypothetical protein
MMIFPHYEKAEDIPQSYHDHMKDMGLTDEQKLELVHNLQDIIQYFYDKTYGVGQFAWSHDAEKYREERKAHYEAEDKKTPEKLYQDGYHYWMGKYGKYYKKAHGQEAAEAKCTQFAQDWVRTTLESRRRWNEFKNTLHASEPITSGKRRPRRKSNG